MRSRRYTKIRITAELWCKTTQDNWIQEQHKRNTPFVHNSVYLRFTKLMTRKTLQKWSRKKSISVAKKLIYKRAHAAWQSMLLGSLMLADWWLTGCSRHLWNIADNWLSAKILTLMHQILIRSERSKINITVKIGKKKLWQQSCNDVRYLNMSAEMMTILCKKNKL